MSETSSPSPLVVTRGIGIDIWKDVDSVFVPLLKTDMSPEERQGAVRKVLADVGQIDAKLNLVSGEMLFEVHANRYWENWTYLDTDTGDETSFKSFADWCEREGNMRERKAYYLLSIYRVFCVELDIPIDILRELEWPKASMLAAGSPPIITKDNWKELLEKIRLMSARDVAVMVRAMKAELRGVGSSEPSVGSGGDVSSGRASDDLTVRKTFSMTPEQAETVEVAFRLAGELSKSEKPGWLLELICADFIASSAGTGPKGALIKLDVARRCLERAFGVRLEVSEFVDDRYESGGGETVE